MKLFSLENRLLKISLDFRNIKFGLQTRELWLMQFDHAVVIMCWNLSEFNASEILTPREQVDDHLVLELHLPILKWEFKTPTHEADGNKFEDS